jgi:YesN/AraC family two-component response regulator
LNPVYFGAYFKKKTGYTVNQYINNVRVNIAKKILLSGEYTVGEVANRCGFQDMFYFSKVFKQIEGVPPSHFVK